MAHYYFDLKDGLTERDHAGVDLPSDAEAIARAQALADEIGQRPPANRGHDRHICIIREDGHEVTRDGAEPDASRGGREKSLLGASPSRSR